MAITDYACNVGVEMSVDSIRAYNDKLYDQLILNRTERRIDELRLEERRIKVMREVTEEARIEMNRRMNRPGQNVDRMA
jgi:hypothetical protein